MNIDFQKAYVLLSVAELALKFSKLKFLHDAAIEQLSKMGEEEAPVVSPTRRAIPAKEIE